MPKTMPARLSFDWFKETVHKRFTAPKGSVSCPQSPASAFPQTLSPASAYSTTSSPGTPKSPLSPFSDSSSQLMRRQRSLIRRSSQCEFNYQNQTVLVLDWDDTLYPCSFVEHESGLRHDSPADQQTHMKEEELNAVLEKIEECQASAEALLKCAQNHGRVLIVTLSTKGLLEKRCQMWYPRVWKLLMGGDATTTTSTKITIVYARDLHRAEMSKRFQQGLSQFSSSASENSSFSTSYWAWVKGRAITQELNRFYSQYKGQTWKNVISIGDSNVERYGVLGAANAYVQKHFSGSPSGRNAESSAYVQGWQRFDSDADWSDSLEGVYEGHMFKVRAKVLKLLDAPSPADIAKQLTMVLQWLPLIVCFDGCLNLVVDELNEKTVKSLESALQHPPSSDSPVSTCDFTLEPAESDLTLESERCSSSETVSEDVGLTDFEPAVLRKLDVVVGKFLSGDTSTIKCDKINEPLLPRFTLRENRKFSKERVNDAVKTWSSEPNLVKFGKTLSAR